MEFSELTDPEMFEAVNGDWNPTIALGFYSPTTFISNWLQFEYLTFC